MPARFPTPRTNIAESAEDSIPAYVASCAFFFALCRLELSKPTITYYRGLNSYQYYFFFGGVFLIMIIVYVMGPKTLIILIIKAPILCPETAMGAS